MSDSPLVRTFNALHLQQRSHITIRKVPTQRQGLVKSKLVKKNYDGHRVKSGQPAKSIKTLELNI